jgi:hypothetical protein
LRPAADADVPAEAGVGRTLEVVVGQASSVQAAAGLNCTSAQKVDGSGLAVVIDRCTGAVPSSFPALGDLLRVSAPWLGRSARPAARPWPSTAKYVLLDRPPREHPRL